ncbi:MAG: AI-2E family transporter [Elusimicrobia bacterium]|nr:AI-2E family transporter [Elusimicrobiota bacterium]
MTPAPEAPPQIERHRIFQVFFFGIFGLVAWQLHRIVSPFYFALAGAALLGLVVYPLHDRVSKRTRLGPSGAAAATTALVVLIVVLPLLSAGWVAVRQASKLVPVVSAWMQERRGLPLAEILPPRVSESWSRLSVSLKERGIDPQENLLEALEQLSRSVTGLAGAALRNLVFFFFQVGILVFSLFFILRDGAKVFRRAVELVPMPEEHKTALIGRLQTTILAVLRGIFIVAGAQGLLAMAGFLVFGVPFAVLLGMVTALFAPIPFVGTGAVWVPVAVGLALSGSYQQAVGVTLWCALVVGMADNLLRPILIGKEAKLPILFLFFGMLGGLRVYGFSGLLVGPVVVALFLAFTDIYRQEYRWILTARKEGT